MKNKLRKTIPLMGLSLVIASGIMCNHSYAGYCSSHDYGSWSSPYYSSDHDRHVMSRKCTNQYFDGVGNRKCTYKEYIEFHNPTINLTMKNPTSNVPNSSNYYFEEGMSLTSGSVVTITSSNGENNTTASSKDSYTTNIYINGTSNPTLNLSGYSLGGPYSLTAKIKDTYYEDDNEIDVTKTFYIGPYPTIYYNAHLIDGNVDGDYSNHNDKIDIKNIKLLSTYEPTELKFELHANGTTKTFNAYVDSVQPYFSTDGTTQIGYTSTFKPISNHSLGINVNPTTTPYLKVLVIDGRGETGASETDPTKPKYAKYSTSI